MARKQLPFYRELIVRARRQNPNYPGLIHIIENMQASYAVGVPFDQIKAHRAEVFKLIFGK